MEKVDNNNLEVKTRSDQVYSVYVGSGVHVTGKAGSSTKTKDIKQGAQVSVTLSVRSDGAFQVRTVRAY